MCLIVSRIHVTDSPVSLYVACSVLLGNEFVSALLDRSESYSPTYGAETRKRLEDVQKLQ